MRGSLPWILLATSPFVFGGAIRRDGDIASVQWAPTAAEHAEAVEASTITACCLTIADVLPGKVYGGAYNLSGYAAQSDSYFSGQEREVRPSCFVLPQSSKDVSIAIRTLTQQSRSDDRTCKFAIRSGGHNPITGSSNIQGGITLDLSFMKQVDIAPDRLSVNIGPGNGWQDVYSKLDRQFLGTSGGRAATVGVGGLVTGGGISFFSRERGLVCDNVLEFEVVLSDASIVIANNVTNSDLWRALKGGSGNFGIVTRIKMKTFELGNMWGGIIFHKKDDDVRHTLFKLFEDYTANTQEVNAHWIHSWSYVNAVVLAEWQSSSNIQYTKPINNPPFFDRLRSRDLDGSSSIISLLKNKVQIDTVTGLVKQIESYTSSGARQSYTSLTFKNSARFMEEVYQIGNDIAPSIKFVTGLRWTISFQSLPRVTYTRARQTGDNSLGLTDGQDDLVILLLTSTWTLSIDDDRMYEAAQTFGRKVEKRAKEKGLYHPFIYLNYADKWQDPIKGYGKQNVDALMNIARKYDARGLFQSKQVPGGFKLPKSADRVQGWGSNKAVADAPDAKDANDVVKLENVADTKDVRDDVESASAGAPLDFPAAGAPVEAAAEGAPVDLPAVDVPAVDMPVEEVPAIVVPVEEVPATV